MEEKKEEQTEVVAGIVASKEVDQGEWTTGE